jgi:hypothetical protein
MQKVYEKLLADAMPRLPLESVRELLDDSRIPGFLTDMCQYDIIPV